MQMEEKVRLMTWLARYEQKEGKRYLKISKYYRSDYIGICLLKNFFASTFAYVLLLTLIGMCRMDAILKAVNALNTFPLILGVIGGYILMLLVYSAIVYTLASVRYAKAKKSVGIYDAKLKRLEQIYEKKEKDTVQRTAGGRNV